MFRSVKKEKIKNHFWKLYSSTVYGIIGFLVLLQSKIIKKVEKKNKR